MISIGSSLMVLAEHLKETDVFCVPSHPSLISRVMSVSITLSAREASIPTNLLHRHSIQSVKIVGLIRSLLLSLQLWMSHHQVPLN